MVKQVDTTDLKSVAERRTGSTPVFPTNICPGGVMVATLVLGTSAVRRVGSSPTLGTKYCDAGVASVS